MAWIFNMEFLILLLMAASTRAGAFPVNDQNNPYSSDYFSESGEDEDLRDLSQLVERLLQKEQAPCRQCNHEPDQSAIGQELRTSDINFDAYSEVKEEPQNNRFNDYESPLLQSNINAPKTGQAGSSPFDDVSSHESNLKNGLIDLNDGQMKERNFSHLRGQRDNLTDKGAAQMKRTNFGGFGVQRGRLNGNNTLQMKSRPTLFEKSDACNGQLKRTHFDGFGSQRRKKNINCTNEVKGTNSDGFRRQRRVKNDACIPRMKRTHFDGFGSQRRKKNINCTNEVKGTNSDGFRRQRRVKNDACIPRMKRTHFDGFGSQRRKKNINCTNEVKGTNSDGFRRQQRVKTDACIPQMKRTHFDGFGSQRVKKNNNCTNKMKRTNFDGFESQTRTLSPDKDGQMKRADLDYSRSPEGNLTHEDEGQMKRNHFQDSRLNMNPTAEKAGEIRRRNNYFRVQPNEQNSGGVETLETEGSQIDRNFPPIQRSNFDYLESEQKQSRKIAREQVDIQTNDYNADEPQTLGKYVYGQEFRQILDDRPQHLQPELDRNPPVSDPLYDADVDYGILQEKMPEAHEVHYNADKDKESSTADETSSDDLFSWLVNLIRDKRQKGPPEN